MNHTFSEFYLFVHTQLLQSANTHICTNLRGFEGERQGSTRASPRRGAWGEGGAARSDRTCRRRASCAALWLGERVVHALAGYLRSRLLCLSALGDCPWSSHAQEAACRALGVPPPSTRGRDPDFPPSSRGCQRSAVNHREQAERGTRGCAQQQTRRRGEPLLASNMAHGRRALSENGGSANKPRASSRSSRKGAALPLKFFNVKTSERFVFKRKDKRCLTLSPRSSLIPVFIHFSDFFPDLVQATLTKCKALILGCERVVILRPNQVLPRAACRCGEHECVYSVLRLAGTGVGDRT
jgi:hypothetical protein